MKCWQVKEDNGMIHGTRETKHESILINKCIINNKCVMFLQVCSFNQFHCITASGRVQGSINTSNRPQINIIIHTVINKHPHMLQA